MNIAVYLTRFLPAQGGIIQYVTNLVVGLINHDIAIEIHTDNLMAISKKEKALILTGGMLNGRIKIVAEPVLIPSLHLRIIKATNADIINVHGHAEAFTPNILIHLSRLNRPIILTTHGSLISSLYGIGMSEYNQMLRIIGMKLKCKIFNSISIKLIDKYVNVIVTPSELEKKALVVHGIPSYRIAIIRNFIPDSYYEYKPQEPEAFLEQYNLEPYRYIITVARIDYNKGIHHVIKAIADLHSRGTNVNYVVIGPNEGALNYCLSIARKYGIERNIVYLGTIYDKRVILALERYAIAFVLPSYIEGAQPLSILEAMSQHTPVIISNTANIIGRTIRYMFNGLIFNYGDIRSLARAIRMLLEDENLRKKLGENAFRYAYEHHRLSKAVEKYMKIYRTLYEIYYR